MGIFRMKAIFALFLQPQRPINQRPRSWSAAEGFGVEIAFSAV